MNKQLIISGFHRSGTSMLAQELYNAGLYIGDKLMESGISNLDGHYEDIDFFHFHEKIFQAQNINWQHTSPSHVVIPDIYKSDMHRMINIRNKHHKEWGFKDPRSTLFLDAWHKELNNPYIVVIYRHYEECVNSLLHRAAGDVIYNKSSDISFWEDPILAYKMWLSYNKKLIEHVKKYPEKSIVVSQHAVINGYPIIKKINDKFGFNLDTKYNSHIKKSLLSPSYNKPFTLEENLRNDLEETWNVLESLSINTPSALSISTIIEKKINIQELKETFTLLDIQTDNHDLEEIIQLTRLNTIHLEEKIKILQDKKNLFNILLSNDTLIIIIKKLLNDFPKNIPLHMLLIDIYINNNYYEKAEYTLLNVCTLVDVVKPVYFYRLANILIQKKSLEKAKYYIDKALTGNPNNAQFYMTTSKIFYIECQYKKSLEELDKALKIKINNVNVEINFNLRKINILLELNQTLEAQKIFEKLLKKYPSNKKILAKEAYFNQRKSKKIIDKTVYYQNILQELKKYPYLYNKVVILYNRLPTTWAKNDFLIRFVKHLNNLNVLPNKK